MKGFQYHKDADGIVTITMDMTGPVNAMNSEYFAAMADTVSQLEAEQDVIGVIIRSAKKTFFAGGDLNDLVAIEPGSEAAFFEQVEATKAVLRRLEKLPVPVVAAINGAALGGGFEICLCCNYRLAWAGFTSADANSADDKSPDANSTATNKSGAVVGLPEVTLGLMPGAGGVVRLTQLLGFETALPYLLDGRAIPAQQAMEAGLIDGTVATLDELLPKAKAWLLANRDNLAAAVQPWDRKGYAIPGGRANSPQLAPKIALFAVTLRKKTRGLLPAPDSILAVASEAARLDIDTALRIEGRHFAALVTRPEAKNMISANFFQLNEVKGGASRPKGLAKTEIKKLGIIGAGMMGQGIAFVTARAGIEVILKDTSLEAAEKGKAYSAAVIDKLIARGRYSASEKQSLLDLITPTDNAQDLTGCDLIIEAVFENMPLKKQIIDANEVYLSEPGTWASNTSTLPITQLAEASQRAENVIGIHFFSPVDRMRLVEIICGDKTSDATLAKAFDYVQQIKKVPIVVKDSLGFFTSRVFATPLSEATQLLAEGVHPDRIDNLGKAIGMPVGPLASYDEVSQKLGLEIRDTQVAMGLRDPEDDPTPEGTALVRALVTEDNRGGRHHGGGFYEYSDNGKQIWPALIARYYQPEVDAAISDQDIKDRLLFRPVIESLKCLDEGVLKSVADGNIGSLLGIGAPVWTGGYIQFVSTYGEERFRARCAELVGLYGERFLVSGFV